MLDHAADLVVAVGDVGGEYFDLSDEEFLLVGRQLIPGLKHVLRPGRQLRIPGDHPEPFLVLEDSLAQLLVAVVEQVHGADLLDPLLRRMVRRVRRAGGILDQERLRRIGLVDPRHILDRVVGHPGNKIPARLALEREDLGRVAEEVRLPLVGVAADESVEVLEAHADGPLVERPDLACCEGRRVVLLAEPGGGVTVVLQDAADGSLVPGDDAVVAGEACGLLRDDAEARRMVVAPGDERGPRRRAERRGVRCGCIAGPPWRCGPSSAWGSRRRRCSARRSLHRR